MSDIDLLRESIEKLEASKLLHNDAEINIKKLSADVLSKAQGGINKANASESIDKKIEILAGTISEIVAVVEDKYINVEAEHKKYLNQITILEEVLGKLEQNQKKNEETEWDPRFKQRPVKKTF